MPSQREDAVFARFCKQFRDGPDDDQLVCRDCCEEKPKTDFGREPKRRTGFRPYCRDCANKRYVKSKHKRKHEIGLDDWKQRIRHMTLQRLHGISAEELDQLIRDSKGLCAICRQPETKQTHGNVGTDRVDNLCVDHNHITGKVRGLLCAVCNRALGLFRDNPEILESAATYLRLHE